MPNFFGGRPRINRALNELPPPPLPPDPDEEARGELVAAVRLREVFPNGVIVAQADPRLALIELQEFNRIVDGFGAAIPAVYNQEKDMDIKRGEELFHLILSGIREIYDVEAVIAGGAVRDFVVDPNKKPKDIDVFIPMKWSDFAKKTQELGWTKAPMKRIQGDYEENRLDSNARASAVVQGHTIDLVFLDKPLDKKGADSFPIHAQRCVYTLKSGIVVSPLAQKDIDNKTFTIDPTITDKEKIKKCLDRIKTWKKHDCYKDWTAVEPTIKHWWEEEDEIPF